MTAAATAIQQMPSAATNNNAASAAQQKNNSAAPKSARRRDKTSQSAHKRMSLENLRKYAESLGVDTHGPQSALVARIDMFLAVQNESASKTGQGAESSESGTNAANGKQSDSSSATKNASALVAKKRRRRKRATAPSSIMKDVGANDADKQQTDKDLDAVIEYVPEPLLASVQDESEREAFAGVFAKFAPKPDDDADQSENEEEPPMHHAASGDNDDDAMDLDDSDDSDEGGSSKTLSKKKLRKLQRLTLAELKQLVRRPEVVEWVDVSAADPKLLVHLKSYRNSVPVPVHWSQKRRYLQHKRGLEKSPFELPDFIKQTGITKIREAVREKEDASKLKTKTRERHQPKMGKLEIDYQKLHDAFFRWQTKPKLTLFGDVYFEGREFEAKLPARKPGDLSDELKFALNIPPMAPPPWLINMQRYGPPPSYPRLKIPGLNAPIPHGAHWGYHPGGWGKPPVDEYNRPLYGDVFGTSGSANAVPDDADVDRMRWGELIPEKYEEEKEEEEEFEQEEEDAGEEQSAPETDGLATPSGLASVPSGLETPDFLELRKRPVFGTESATGTSDTPQPKQLYKVLDQRETSIRGFMGSEYVYDVSGASDSKTAAAKRKLGIAPSTVEVTINPDELAGDVSSAAASGINTETIKRKYDEQTQAIRSNASVTQNDFSDLVAEHAQKQAKKRQKKEESSSGSSSKKDKTKEFKF